MAYGVVGSIPVELFLEQLLLKQLLLLVLFLNLTHLGGVHEPVHLLEPLPVLFVHQFHKGFVLCS